MLGHLVLGGIVVAPFTPRHAREHLGIIWMLAIQGITDTLLQVRWCQSVPYEISLFFTR
jgi:hypothetical protein